MEKRIENIITDKGIIRRTIDERIVCTNEEALQNICDQSPRYAPIGKLVELDSGIAIYKDCICLSMILNEISLKTKYELLNDYMVPTFEMNGTGLLLDYKWKIPDDMSVILTCCVYGGQMKVYLSAWSYREKQIYKLPLPNTHADSAICMGNNFNYSGSDLLSSARRMMKVFESAEWNTDLIGDTHGNHKKMFMFDPDGKQLGVENWESLALPIGVKELAHIGQIL